MSGYAIIERIRAAVSSATYRVHPDADAPLPPDFYSPAIDSKAIVPGTVIYDPAGHLAIVYRVDPDGRVHFFDAHTDYSLTQLVYDLRFMRARPADGAGFKNWRPIRLVGATRQTDGTLKGGHIAAAANKDIADFSDEQYFGNGPKPADEDWARGAFALNGERLDYYDYVRAKLAGGQLMFDPVREIGEMASSVCSDLNYRVQSVNLALGAGMADKSEPAQLPRNIYGTSGAWEIYSTPSRDARLKTAFKALRDIAQRFIEMRQRGGAHLDYSGTNLAADMLAAYERATSQCRIAYTRSDGSSVTLGYEDARAAVRDVVRSLSMRGAPLGRRGGGAFDLSGRAGQTGVVCGRAEPAQPDRPHLRRAHGFHARRTADVGPRQGCRFRTGHGRSNLSGKPARWVARSCAGSLGRAMTADAALERCPLPGGRRPATLPHPALGRE